MTLKEHIDEIRKYLREGKFTNEASVSGDIVRRLLNTLGWSVSVGPKVVFPEFPVGKGEKVDFALCHPPSQPLVFIEVKKVGKIDEEAQEQLFGYLSRKIVEIAILTDGREWRFFYPRGLGDHDERKVCQINLIETNLDEIAERLSRYLNYESICDGSAIKAFQDDHQEVFMRRQIEEVWSNLLESESALVKLMVKEVRNLRRHEPTGKQVLNFLNNLEKVELQPSPPPIQEDVPNPHEKKPQTHLVVTMPDGERIDRPVAADTFADVIEKLGLEQVEEVKPKLLSTSNTYRNFRKRGRYDININLNNDQKKNHLEDIAEALGVRLNVKIIPKN